MVAVLGSEKWVASAVLVHRHPCVGIRSGPGEERKQRIPYPVARFGLELRGDGPSCRNAELRRGQCAMAGSTSVNGFHSSSLVQRDGRIAPSGFFGGDGSGVRGGSYASCRRLRIRKRVVNHEGASAGFMCYGDDGTSNVRVPRARAVESLETASPGIDFAPSGFGAMLALLLKALLVCSSPQFESLQLLAMKNCTGMGCKN